MTTPIERTRALLWAGGFLVELAQDRKLPLAVRRQAVTIARHFPTIEDISSLAQARHEFFGTGLASPDEVPPTDMGRIGPLRWSTRLAWPDE